ncbi:MAG TPA: hypothetical protein VHM29_00275 [Acidimicrobiia bacterium]|nr:hypothetical protein [Acidimicrobiia bacterium]
MSPESIRRHQAIYRRLVSLTPRAHRLRHGEEQVALFGDLLTNGENPLRLWMQAFPDLVTVIRQTRARLTHRTTRIALGIASLGPIGLGMILGWISIDEYGDVPILFPITAIALVMQGVFTLLWLTHALDHWERNAKIVFVAGEAAALVVGSIVALGSSTVPGPMIAGVVIAAQAGLGLVVAAR